MKTFTLIIEKNPKGVYRGQILELPGCEAKADKIDELIQNIRNAIYIYVSMKQDYEVKELEFVGVQRIKIPLRELKNCMNDE